MRSLIVLATLVAVAGCGGSETPTAVDPRPAAPKVEESPPKGTAPSLPPRGKGRSKVGDPDRE